MPYIKLLTALTALALLTACGGGTAKTPDNNGGSGNATDCTQTPFHNDCLTNNAPALALRITDCITAGNAGDTKCASLTSDATMNTAINTCLTNPFDESCTASDFTFSTYAEMARVNRVSFCGMTGNAGNALCTALTTCQANPFGATCGAYFESAKNPYCETNPTEAPCVNTADWVASFTANGGTALPTIPDATTRKNEFLQATATGFASGATDGIMIPLGTPIPAEIVIVKFADADTATGGMAFFNGGVYNDSDERLGTGRFFYAGILAGTNLGAPITETITSVRWTGQIRADATESGAILSENPTAGFGVDITFDGAEGTIEETFVSTGSFVYSIDGDFDANGIITGTVDFGRVTVAGGDVRGNRIYYSPGTLSGIIGQNGAVGVFHSDNANPEAGLVAALFSGGFVVTPPPPDPEPLVINHADWLAVATPLATRTTPTAKNEFLQGTATGLITITDTDSTAVTLATAKYDSLALGGESADGFAYYSDNTNHYAGILLNTNLGAPLTATSAVALWRGQFSVLEGAGAVVSTSFSLGVSFTDTATGGTITGESGLQDYAFTGTFDARGVIDGTITRSVVVGTSPNQTLATRAGTLTGLIGFDGAVGAFHSNADVADSYYGGFVARATRPVAVADTAPALVQYEDWAAIVSPDATPNTTARRNQFLQGTPADAPSNKGLNAGVGYTANGFGNQPTADIVDFENGVPAFFVAGIGGDAADGFAFFNGLIGGVRHYYASILPTTNLGAPLTESAQGGAWEGILLVDVSVNDTFILTVDFGKREVSSPASATNDFFLKGTWDERGVITGTTLSALYLDDARTMLNVDSPNIHGILTGLIGQDGAVGVFHSNNDGIGQGYTGGFIVAPPTP